MDPYTVLPTRPDILDREFAEYSPLLRTLLHNRGIKTREEAEIFLNPVYERDIQDPFGILNMEKAVSRILLALTKKEKIVIYGDYDCDGIPGSVVLHDFFKKIEYPHFSNYIPHRHKEGYGLNEAAVKLFHEQGATLLITVDCGITDVKEIALAESLGINVILTDHHLPGEILPPAFAIINSKQENDTYHDDALCGAGTAWKLVQALALKGNTLRGGTHFTIPLDWEKWLLDMAGLSTVADMVPLRKENRAIAYFGLKVLRKSARPGLHKLLSLMRISQNTLTEDDIGFMIAPRVNAASRMGVPFDAFLMLGGADPKEAAAFAEKLHKTNDERKWKVAQISKEVKQELAHREIKDVIVIGNPSWPVGVLGIVGNNLMEEYNRPVFVWGREGTELIKGSCRSDGSVNLVTLMHKANNDLFIDIGGHELAGGFSISTEKIHLLEDALILAYRSIRKDPPPNETRVDMELSLSDVNWNMYRDIEKLSPFGMGNPKPIFLFSRVSPKEVKRFGKTKEHLEIVFSHANGNISATGFFVDENTFPNVTVEPGASFDLLASVEKNTFKRTPELRLRIVDIHASR